MDNNLKNKNVIVTGGLGGIGYSIVKKFYEEGNPKLKKCFWIYCRKTWTKAITTANHSRKNISFSQWELEVKTKKLPEARGFKLTNRSLV